MVYSYIFNIEVFMRIFNVNLSPLPFYHPIGGGFLGVK